MSITPSVDGPATSFGSVFKNAEGYLLMYTVQSTMQGCEEHCRKFWGNELFDKFLDMGGKIVHIEVQEVITTYVIDKHRRSMTPEKYP